MNEVATKTSKQERLTKKVCLKLREHKVAIVTKADKSVPNPNRPVNPKVTPILNNKKFKSEKPKTLQQKVQVQVQTLDNKRNTRKRTSRAP